MSRKNILDYLAYVAVRILICIVQALRLEPAASWPGPAPG